MTDQQTSRTNITEALRQALAAHRLNVLDIGVVDHCTSGCAESIARALADDIEREARAASASVPPLHTDDAGSPLGSTTEGTSFGPKPAGDVSGELGLRDASLASAIVTESVTSAVPPLDRWHGDGDECTGIHCMNPKHGWTAEAPEQGRGDESR